MFTSGTQARDGRTVNHDPKPWRLGREYTQGEPPFERSSVGYPGMGDFLDPRPEYDVEDNPILARFRECLDEGLPFTTPAEWGWHLTHPLPGAWGYANPEQVDHAHRVLRKLAAAYGE